MASLGEASSKFSKGDFCAFIVRGVLLCSFHGDTDGLQTKTIVAAANAYVRDNADAVAACVFGMDANTHVAHIDGKKQGVRDFIEFLERETAFKSCWTLAGVDVERDAFTTFSARTHLQAQLNKAVPRAEVLTSPLTDRHPKDHVLIYAPDDTGRETTTTTRPPPSIRRVNAVDFSAGAAAARFRPRRLLPERQIPVRSRGRRVHDALATLTHLDSPSLARTRAFRVPRALSADALGVPAEPVTIRSRLHTHARGVMRIPGTRAPKEHHADASTERPRRGGDASATNARMRSSVHSA